MKVRCLVALLPCVGAWLIIDVITWPNKEAQPHELSTTPPLTQVAPRRHVKSGIRYVSRKFDAAFTDSTPLVVGNVPYNMGEEQLIDVFKSVGQVVGFRCLLAFHFFANRLTLTEHRLVYDRDSGKPKGYGFCEFAGTFLPYLCPFIAKLIRFLVPFTPSVRRCVFPFRHFVLPPCHERHIHSF